MRFYTVNADGMEKVMISVDGGQTGTLAEDLGYYFKDMNDLICSAEKDPSLIEKLGNLAASLASARKLSSFRILAPIVRPLQDVICLGINFDEHAKEAGTYSAEAFGGERPYTIYFSKRVSRAVGCGEPIPSHRDIVDKLDYECELGVVIGKTASKISAGTAADYIFGYTIINDVTARNLQTRHKQWYVGKSLDGFTPMGPCIVTADELGNPADLGLSCTVNDELRQNSNTSCMIQTVDGAVTELSAGITLTPGTIIAMGTPSGVGMGFNPPRFLQPGDKVCCHIDKIGDLINTVE